MGAILDNDNTTIRCGLIDEPGVINVSNSKVKQWRRCPMKWKYRNIDYLVKKKKALPLTRGSWIHECLESLYKLGDWKIGYDKYKKEVWDKLFIEERIEFGELDKDIRDIMERYVKYYSKWHKNIIILGVEVPFQIRVPQTPINLTGKIDLIYEDEIGLWALDHKTMKTLPTEEFRATDTQLTLYYYILNFLAKHGILKGEKIAGVEYNYIRTKAPVIPQLLKKGGLSKRKNIDTDFDTYLKAITDNGLDPKDYQDILESLRGKEQRFFTRRRLPKSKILISETIKDIIYSGCQMKNALNNPSYRYVRNFTKDCGWDCEYYDLCYSEVMGNDITQLVNSEYEIEETEEWEEKEEDN